MSRGQKTPYRFLRAITALLLGALPGIALLGANGVVSGEWQLVLGMTAIALAGIGAGVGAVYGWLGRPPAPFGLVATLLVAAAFLFGGLPGRVLGIVALCAWIALRTLR